MISSRSRQCSQRKRSGKAVRPQPMQRSWETLVSVLVAGSVMTGNRYRIPDENLATSERDRPKTPALTMVVLLTKIAVGRVDPVGAGGMKIVNAGSVFVRLV